MTTRIKKTLSSREKIGSMETASFRLGKKKKIGERKETVGCLGFLLFIRKHEKWYFLLDGFFKVITK